jgi:maleylacetate reductase
MKPLYQQLHAGSGPDGAAQFVYASHPSRVIFGAGTIGRLPEEVKRLGLSRVLVVSTPGQQHGAQKVAAAMPGRIGFIFSGATMHTPVDVTEQAMEIVRAERIDGLVAVGGGSTTGLAKAIAYRTDLPQIIGPTTYAGSEMTPILGETENGIKVTVSDPKILPEVVIYDVDLTMTLSVAISVSSGMNAIAHAVEALYSKDRNPIISMFAEYAIAALARSLPAIFNNPSDVSARTEALYGAWLCGICLGSVGMALHHKLCHALGGAFNLPHAEMHTAVLPHVVAYNETAAPEAMQAIARALGTDPVDGLFELAQGLNATMALRDFGMPEQEIDPIAELALKNAYPNPRALERDAIRELLAAAWAGKRPERASKRKDDGSGANSGNSRGS